MNSVGFMNILLQSSFAYLSFGWYVRPLTILCDYSVVVWCKRNVSGM